MHFKTIGLIGLFLFSFCFLSTAQSDIPDYNPDFFNGFPSYEEILRYTSKAKPDVISAPDHKYQFEKTVDGWYLRPYESLEEFESSDPELLWSSETGQYADQEVLETANSTNLKRFLERKFSSFQADYYDFCPLFGYDNYEDDLISLLENARDLSAGCMDCYARALSAKATAIINPYQLTGEAVFLKYDSTLVASDLSEDILFSYLEAADNSLEAFRQLSQTYPEYYTIVGNIRQKYFNEIMSVFYNLSFSGKPDIAKKYLPDGLYEEAILEFSKNTLLSCPDNSILFTWGDNDTYPLVYLQEKLGFRKDVTIINISFSNIGKYVNYLTNLLDDKRRIVTTLDMNAFKLHTNNVLRIDPGMDNPPATLTEYLQQLKSDPDRFTVINEDQEWGLMPFKKTVIPMGLDDAGQPVTITTEFIRSFIMKSDLFTLDLLATNNGIRPVCFTLGFRGSRELGLDKYRKFDGYVMTLTPDKSQLQVDPAELNQTLMTLYTFPKISKKQAAHGEYRFFSGNGLFLFYLLLNGYLADEQYDDFFRVYDSMNLKLPYEIFPYERYHLVFAQLLLDAGDKPKAGLHLDALASELTDNFIAYNKLDSKDLLKKQKEISRSLKTMKELLQFSGDFFDSGVFEKFEIQFRPILLEWENKG